MLTSAVIYGDSHWPFCDVAAHQLVRRIVRDVQPNVLVHIGDGVDCWQISKFDKDPTRRDTLQDNIDGFAAHLATMVGAAPKAKRFFFEGNHEDRLRRLLWQMDGPSKELINLRNVQAGVTWPNLLNLKELEWNFVPIAAQPITGVLPKMVVEHGSLVRQQAGASARAELDKYGRTGISGHTHRLCEYRRRDLNGQALWLESGCVCQLDGQQYGHNFNWQSGCVVIEWSSDLRILQPTLVTFREGRCVWHGREW